MEKLRGLLESTESDDILFFNLSETYEKLRLKNVRIPDDIQVKAEMKLLDHHFITSNTKLARNDNFKSFEHVKEHLDFTCIISDEFLSKYFEKDFEVDLEFMFWAKYIAQNMSVLKRRIDYTYEMLPWEEMQFCLVIYLDSLAKGTHADIVYKLILDRNRILKHLFYFRGKLTEVKKNFKEENLTVKKAVNRNTIKNKIIKESPFFKELYEDFSILRDVFSLTKIKNYLEQALSVNITQNNMIGQLVIERTLQVMGECLKNTVDSPNLSDYIYKFLMRTAPRNLRSILANVRNMLSHAFSLNRKLELEGSKDIDFFKNIQLDLKRVQVEIVYMLYQQKINALKMFLIKILDQNQLHYIESIFKELNIEEFKINNEYYVEFEDIAKVKELINLFCQKVLEESNEDIDLIQDAKRAMESYNTKINHLSSMFIEGVKKLKNLQYKNKTELTTIHSIARTYLVTLASSEPQSLFKEIFKKLQTIYENFKKRRNYDENNFLKSDEKSTNLGTIIHEIYNHLKWGMRKIKWIEEIENKLTVQIDADQEKIQKISQIFQAVENKLNKDEDKIILRNVVTQKQQIHLNKADIIHDFDKDPETFKRLVKSLNLSAKREKEILNNFEIKKFDRLQLQLKEVNDDYGTLLKQLGDIFPLNKYVNALKTFYNNLKLKKPLQIKILMAVDEVVQKQVTYSYSRRLEILKNLMRDSDFLTIQENKYLKTAIEMLVLDLAEYLENVKLLGDDKLFLLDSLPLLKGKQLRNYLAHGDLLTDILPYNPLISIIFYAEKLADLGEAILSQNNILIGCTINYENINLQDYFEKCLCFITSQELMYEYILKNDSPKVAEIINNGAEPQGISVYGWTVLDFAIHAGSLQLFKLFLNNNAQSKQEIFNWLKSAIISGQFNIVQYVVNEFKVDINYKYENNMTLLHFALKYGHRNIVQFLIENNGNIYSNQISNRKTTLLLALESRMLEIVVSLLDTYVDLVNDIISEDDTTALHIAAKNNFDGAVKILLKKNANILIETKNGLTAVEVAAQYGHKNILKTFLENPTVLLCSELLTKTAFLAAESGHLNTLWPLLIKSEYIYNCDGNRFLFRSVFYGHQEDVEMLIKYGADINSSDNNGCQALHLACQCGHTQIVDLLLQNGANINAEDNNKWTPVHWATQNNHNNVVKLLLSKNANGKLYNKNGKTALHLAAENCFVDIFNILLDYTGDANFKTENGETVLHLAAENGHDNIVDILLKIPYIEVTAMTDNDATPLMLAAANGHYKVVEDLLKHRASVNKKSKKEGYTALTQAAVHGYTDIVTILVKYNADIELQEVSKFRALHFTVQNGYLDILDILLRNGVDVNSKYSNNGTALLTATRNGHIDIVQKLIKSGADIHAMMISLLPLRVAAHFGYEDIVLLLLKNGANINATGKDQVSPLHSAAWNGHKEVVDLLLKNGADVNSKTEEEWSALHFAAKFGYYDIVTLLIENGADISSKNNFGATVFHTACEMGYSDIVAVLLERYNVNVDIKNTDGWTGLHWASANEHINVVNVLIKHNAIVGVKANDASTPLHWAVQYAGSTDIVDILIKNGAEINVKDAKGSTPLHLASLNGYKYVVKILLENNADVNAKNSKVTALHLAATFGHYEIIKMLLEKGANVNDKGLYEQTGLHLAAAKGHMDIIHILLKNGIEISARDAFGMTPLHWAAEKGFEDIVKVLITSHSEINTKSNNGYTPLYSAIENGHENIAALLITNNSERNTKIYEESTILHLAIKKGMINIVLALIHRGINLDADVNSVSPLMESLYSGHTNIAVLLIQNNANINMATDQNWAPLHVTAGKGYKKVFKLLVESKADINVKTSNWETPLYFASQEGHLDIVNELLKNNADVNVQTRSNYRSALSVAAQEGHTEIIELLIKHNADVNVKAEIQLTPLHLSALFGHEKSAQVLIRHNANVNDKTDNHYTALHLAAAEGNTSIVKLLLENSVENIDDQTDEEATPICLAVEQGHKTVVEELLKYKANTEIGGKNGLPLTELATQKGFIDIAKILLRGAQYYPE